MWAFGRFGHDHLSDLRCLGRGCDFLQPRHPSNVAVFVDNLPILIRFGGFKFHWFIADTAFRQSRLADKSQKCWHCAAFECEMVRSHCATEAEGRGRDV
jgi:hypothetical protein